MVSQHLQAESWFRFPLPTRMRRDALLVDVPIPLSEETPDTLREYQGFAQRT